MKNTIFADISDYWQKGRGFIAIPSIGVSLLVVVSIFQIKILVYILLGGLAGVIFDFLAYRRQIGGWTALMLFALFLFILYISQPIPVSPTYQGCLEEMRRYPSGIILFLDCEHDDSGFNSNPHMIYHEKVTAFIPEYAEINFRGNYPSIGDDVWVKGTATDGRVLVEDPQHLGFHNLFW